MKKFVSKSQFKPRALEYFREVERTAREVIITDRGRPVLKIVRYSEKPEAWMKLLRGSVLSYKDPTGPVGAEDWDALK